MALVPQLAGQLGQTVAAAKADPVAAQPSPSAPEISTPGVSAGAATAAAALPEAPANHLPAAPTSPSPVVVGVPVDDTAVSGVVVADLGDKHQQTATAQVTDTA